MNDMDRALKWVGMGTLVLGMLPLTAVLVREVPGMIREVKLARMGFRGGWKQAH
jgi:hypothetical protein